MFHRNVLMRSSPRVKVARVLWVIQRSSLRPLLHLDIWQLSLLHHSSLKNTLHTSGTEVEWVAYGQLVGLDISLYVALLSKSTAINWTYTILNNLEPFYSSEFMSWRSRRVGSLKCAIKCTGVYAAILLTWAQAGWGWAIYGFNDESRRSSERWCWKDTVCRTVSSLRRERRME